MKSKIITVALLLFVSVSVYAIISNIRIQEKDILPQESLPTTDAVFRSNLEAKETLLPTKIEDVLHVPKASDVSWHVRSF